MVMNIRYSTTDSEVSGEDDPMKESAGRSAYYEDGAYYTTDSGVEEKESKGGIPGAKVFADHIRSRIHFARFLRHVLQLCGIVFTKSAMGELDANPEGFTVTAADFERLDSRVKQSNLAVLLEAEVFVRSTWNQEERNAQKRMFQLGTQRYERVYTMNDKFREKFGHALMQRYMSLMGGSNLIPAAEERLDLLKRAISQYIQAKKIANLTNVGDIILKTRPLPVYSLEKHSLGLVHFCFAKIFDMATARPQNEGEDKGDREEPRTCSGPLKQHEAVRALYGWTHAFFRLAVNECVGSCLSADVETFLACAGEKLVDAFDEDPNCIGLRQCDAVTAWMARTRPRNAAIVLGVIVEDGQVVDTERLLGFYASPSVQRKELGMFDLGKADSAETIAAREELEGVRRRRAEELVKVMEDWSFFVPRGPRRLRLVGSRSLPGNYVGRFGSKLRPSHFRAILHGVARAMRERAMLSSSRSPTRGPQHFAVKAKWAKGAQKVAHRPRSISNSHLGIREVEVAHCPTWSIQTDLMEYRHLFSEVVSLSLTDCEMVDNDMMSTLNTIFPGLRSLSVRGCWRVSEFPESLRQIRRLDVSCTSIGGDSLASALRLLLRLETLNISYLKLSESVFVALERHAGTLTSLSASCLSQQTSRVQYALHQISSRYISMATISQLFLLCSHLRDLDLSGQSFVTNEIVRNIVTTSSRLADLRLDFCVHLTYEAVHSIMGELKYLRVVSIKGVNLSGDDWSTLTFERGTSFFVNLTKVFLCGSMMEDYIFDEIFNTCERLETLAITSGSQLHRPAPRRHQRHLQQLSFDNCRKLTTEGLLHVLQLCPSLRDLHIVQCMNVREDVGEAVATHCPLLQSFRAYHYYSNSFLLDSSNVRHLELHNGEYLQDACVSRTLRKCKYLTVLDLRGVRISRPLLYTNMDLDKLVYLRLGGSAGSAVTDNVVELFVKRARNVRNLQLSFANITRKSLDFLRCNLLFLESLALNGCQECVRRPEDIITADAVLESCSYMPYLNTLDLSYNETFFPDAVPLGTSRPLEELHTLVLADCPALEAVCLQNIPSIVPNLKVLNLSYCKAISSTALNSIAMSNPGVRIISW